MNKILISIATVVISVTATHAAEMYKWKDAAGVIHYAQLPPSNQSHEVISEKGKVIDTKEASAKEAGTDELEDEIELSDDVKEIIAKNKADQALADVDAAVKAEKLKLAKENAERCKIAKSNLISLESRPIVRIKENGKTRVLTDTEKVDKIDSTRDQVKEYCR